MNKLNCILLVDDNPDDNEFHSIIIEEAAVCNHIKVVTGGEQALAYLKVSGVNKSNEQTDSPHPDLIFLDINMPRMNGFEFLDEYKKLNENLKAKVVITMLTTSLNPNDRTKALAYGVTEFENKPLTVDMLHRIIAKYF